MQSLQNITQLTRTNSVYSDLINAKFAKYHSVNKNKDNGYIRTLKQQIYNQTMQAQRGNPQLEGFS